MHCIQLLMLQYKSVGLHDNSIVSEIVGAEWALILGERSGIREEREERERSAEREIGEREWSGERHFSPLPLRSHALCRTLHYFYLESLVTSLSD
jgi:hypothetical protein